MDGTEEDTVESNEEKGGFFSRLKSGLQKTRSGLAGGIDRVVNGPAKISPSS